MLLEALALLTRMDMPAALAFAGIAWAISVPLIVRGNLRSQERIKELELKRAIQLETFKKGALTHIEECG